MPLTPIAIKTYTALLSQTSTNNPTQTILHNTIGTINWTYEDVGYYIGTLEGAFPENKTSMANPPIWNKAQTITIQRINNDQIAIETAVSDTFSDNILDHTTITIQTYQ